MAFAVVPAAVVPAGETDVVVVVAVVDLEEAEGRAGDEVGGRLVEIQAGTIVIEVGGDGVENVMSGGAAPTDNNYLWMTPRLI